MHNRIVITVSLGERAAEQLGWIDIVAFEKLLIDEHHPRRVSTSARSGIADPFDQEVGSRFYICANALLLSQSHDARMNREEKL